MLSNIQEEKINKYCERILELNREINLTAITDRNMFHVKHVVDSLACIDLREYINASKIVDVGTGAGFPGIPLAISSPEKEFILIDSVVKKLRIIDMLCDELNITNVKILHGRVEDIGHDKAFREKFDLCISRAVARLNILVEWSLPLLKKGGTMIAYKGLKAEEELKEAKKAIDLIGGSQSRIEKFTQTSNEIIEHSLVIIKKERETPGIYPRKPGKAKREPIL